MSLESLDPHNFPRPPCGLVSGFPMLPCFLEVKHKGLACRQTERWLHKPQGTEQRLPPPGILGRGARAQALWVWGPMAPCLFMPVVRHEGCLVLLWFEKLALSLLCQNFWRRPHGSASRTPLTELTALGLGLSRASSPGFRKCCWKELLVETTSQILGLLHRLLVSFKTFTISTLKNQEHKILFCSYFQNWHRNGSNTPISWLH